MGGWIDSVKSDEVKAVRIMKRINALEKITEAVWRHGAGWGTSPPPSSTIFHIYLQKKNLKLFTILHMHVLVFISFLNKTFKNWTVFISTALQQKHFLYVYDTGMQSWMMRNFQKEEDAKEVWTHLTKTTFNILTAFILDLMSRRNIRKVVKKWWPFDGFPYSFLVVMYIS